MIIMLVLGLAVVVLLIGGAYFFVNSKKTEVPSPTTQQTQAPDNLESDINAVGVGNLDTEFIPVDQDLQTL